METVERKGVPKVSSLKITVHPPPPVIVLPLFAGPRCCEEPPPHSPSAVGSATLLHLYY